MHRKTICALAAAWLCLFTAVAPCLAEEQPARPSQPPIPRGKRAGGIGLPPFTIPGTQGAAAEPAAAGGQAEGQGQPGISPSPAKEGGGKAGGDKFVGLNFDYADINVVIQTIADLIGLNYILAPGVSGKVTIQTSGKIAVADLFFVLQKILEVNNLTAVKSGDFYKIIPLGSINKESLEIVSPAEETTGEQMIIKIFKLKYTTPSEIARLFGNLKSPQGVFTAHDPAGILFVLDSVSRMKMFTELIEATDVDIYQSVQVELYPVSHAQAEDLAKDLTQVVTAVTSFPGRPATRFKLIPVKAINAILFVTSEPTLGEMVKRWARDLDQPATIEAEKVFVYNLNHASAENVASILRELYGEKSTQAGQKTSQQATMPKTVQQAARLPGTPAEIELFTPTRGEASETGVTGKVKIVADKDTNSLIIQTAPWNYPSILEVIKKLDKMPEQVLIEVIIAEISLDDNDTLGLEWAMLTNGSGNVGGESLAFQGQARNVYTSGGPTSTLGFSYLLTEANRLTAVLNAYAKTSKLNIISRPHIMASDNKEAKIDIGQEVPIITAQTKSTEGTQTNQTIEYRSTGVILTVTPHINENRDVTLDITQEVSQAQTNKLGGTDSPIIQKRTAKTSMVVKDNETLVIGGLIQEKKERSREGIPFLSRIPILGYLFGMTTDTLSKTELVIMITPRVITNYDEAAKNSQEFVDKITVLKKGMIKK